eukprot:7384531-Prymnesium_polylepis.1
MNGRARRRPATRAVWKRSRTDTLLSARALTNSMPMNPSAAAARGAMGQSEPARRRSLKSPTHAGATMICCKSAGSSKKLIHRLNASSPGGGSISKMLGSGRVPDPLRSKQQVAGGGASLARLVEPPHPDGNARAGEEQSKENCNEHRHSGSNVATVVAADFQPVEVVIGLGTDLTSRPLEPSVDCIIAIATAVNTCVTPPSARRPVTQRSTFMRLSCRRRVAPVAITQCDRGDGGIHMANRFVQTLFAH